MYQDVGQRHPAFVLNLMVLAFRRLADRQAILAEHFSQKCSDYPVRNMLAQAFSGPESESEEMISILEELW